MTSDMRIIKLYGERNTGTNYLEQLVKINFKNIFLPGKVPKTKIWRLSEETENLYFDLSYPKYLGWKHSRVDTSRLTKQNITKQTCFLTLTKNPYSFLLSLYRHPYAYKGDLPDTFQNFLCKRWNNHRRDNSRLKYYETPIHLWNCKNDSYLKLNEKFISQTYNLTYESLLIDFQSELNKIDNYLNLNRYSDSDFLNFTNSTKESGKSFNDYVSYYLNEVWKKDLNSENIKFINEHLDPRILRAFGYSMIIPTS